VLVRNRTSSAYNSKFRSRFGIKSTGGEHNGFAKVTFCDVHISGKPDRCGGDSGCAGGSHPDALFSGRFGSLDAGFADRTYRRISRAKS
jgi:hypothetical protein